ncbi:TMEM175 family protein [Streptococcus acidominimus]|uniref:TMEM175 family protein n=1 Tax=Streptococcus acidominimus TaxID=1326 RepID=UPI001D16394B|nr:TMEM175 family protein [Streptococcus acidominimus]
MMSSSRLEAFSDGVLAIIITIMVLELKASEVDNIAGLTSLIPSILAYILSFLYVAIYWNNHHHLAKGITAVNPNMLWLLSISFIPWATAWLATFYTSALPVMVYCLVLLMVAMTYLILQNQISKGNPALQKKIERDRKGKLSIILYLISVAVFPSFPPHLSYVWCL